MLFNKPIAITEALRFETLKKVLALTDSVGSQDIQDFIPAHIREQAVFSARTPYAGYLAGIQNKITRMLQPDVVRTGDGGYFPTEPGGSISPAQVRAAMKKELDALNYEPDPEKRGGLQDLSSDRRINLIIDTQLSMARGQGSWRQHQDSDILDLWPADELYRAINPKGQGRNWQRRWNDARADLGDATSATYADMSNGPFVALKNDDIWTAISTFDNPYPPFDYNSGMRVKSVGRRRAIALGVMSAEDRVTPVKDPFNQPQSVSLDRTPPDIADALQAAFGDRASRQGDRLFILPDPIATLKELIFRAAAKDKATGAFAFMAPEQQAQLKNLAGVPVKPGATFAIDADHIRHAFDQHGDTAGEAARGQVAITAEDVLQLPSLVRTGILRAPRPGEVRTPAVIAGRPAPAMVSIDAPGGYVIGGQFSRSDNRLLVHTLYRRAGK